MKRAGAGAAAALLAAGLAACSQEGGSDEADANPYAGYQSNQYAGTAHWLCHPDLAGSANACNDNQDSILVAADGSSLVEPFAVNAAAPIDCFYVYPTTSADPGANSDLNPDLQEIQTTLQQAGRFGAACRLFAPVYRQRTLTLLALDSAVDDAVSDEQQKAALAIAYGDVLDAFKQYMAHDNQGRGFILLGHSQGARLTAMLIAGEVEAHPYLAHRLVAAYIPGTLVEVPVGGDVGGTFQATPACRAVDQAGCVIAYSSYREGDPQLSAPRFGVTSTPGMQALCVNPAALAGGAGTLDARLPFLLPPVFQALLLPKGTGGPYASPVENVTARAQAPFFAVPGQLQARCLRNEVGASYLEVHTFADPADPRADEYPGEFAGGTGWGLHLADMNLAQGDLVRLAQSQGAAWRARH